MSHRILLVRNFSMGPLAALLLRQSSSHAKHWVRLLLSVRKDMKRKLCPSLLALRV